MTFLEWLNDYLESLQKDQDIELEEVSDFSIGFVVGANAVAQAVINKITQALEAYEYSKEEKIRQILSDVLDVAMDLDEKRGYEDVELTKAIDRMVDLSMDAFDE